MGAFNQARGLGGQLQNMGQGALSQGQSAFRNLQGINTLIEMLLSCTLCQ